MFLKSPNILKLSEEQKASCEGRISKEEYKQALEFFKSGKTSGNDRLPVELNKHFWFSLEDYLTASFTSSFEYEEISNSQNKQLLLFWIRKEEIEHIWKIVDQSP